ncbi:MAG: HlyD family type I secretion periplasmic adaptor subunit [Sulfurimonas sp.]|jgi:HlyD family type I secretion membrane fusion protein
MTHEGIPTSITATMKRSLMIYGVIFVAFIIWIFVAKLSSGSVAMGFVVPEGGNKIVSHNEMGFIREIFIHEGDHVKKGMPLMLLDTTENQTSLGILSIQKAELEAILARLKTEEVGGEFQENTLDPVAYNKEREVWSSRRELLGKDESLTQERINQANMEIEALRNDEHAASSILERTREELKSVRSLYQERFVDKTSLFSLESKVAELEGKIAVSKNNQTRLQERKNELTSGFSRIKKDMLYQNATEYRKASDELRVVNEKISFEKVKLARKYVTSPVDGVINRLSFKTVGAVVPAGTPIVEIVPSETRLLAEVKINPDEVRFVHKGTPCYLRFPAYKTRYFNPVNGSIIWISADTVQERDGSAYYLARVAINKDSMKDEKVVLLEAGMRVQAEMRLGTRSVARYIFDPVRMSLIHAFKEK